MSGPENFFTRCLGPAGITIKRYSPESGKAKNILLASGETLAIEKLKDRIFNKITDLDGSVIAGDLKLFRDITEFEKKFREFCETNTLLKIEERIEAPAEFHNLTLNVDLAHPGREMKYFLTKDEYVHPMSGWVYIRTMGLEETEAFSSARQVYPVYLPRSPKGVSKHKLLNEKIDAFNTYVPPKWMEYEGPLPDRLPPLFEKLVNHIFPIKLEREYFYSWLHDSLFKRSMVYLILCGVGGNGKNRLKLVLRALHGHDNSIDGKRSTLKERFNSQLVEATLAWFDELHYDMEMENVMKEIQNDSMSIEKKGIDASRSTQIYPSLVITNNKPRDNYIALDARKFVPLVLSNERLEESMTPDEIDELSKKVENSTSKTFDNKFLAQIGRWLKKHGRSRKWPNLEYKGPMFYKLAHTSMSKWQKKAATLIFESDKIQAHKYKFVEGKGYPWAEIEALYLKKQTDRSLHFPDSSSVKYFFDIFVDAKGKPAFETEMIPGKKNTMGDFYVRTINEGAGIMSESEDLLSSITGVKDAKTENDDPEESEEADEVMDL